MHLKASTCPTVVVLYVSFSYPVGSVRRYISFKLNQVGPVVMLVHVARLSKCKVGLLLRLGVGALFVLGRLRRAFRLYVWLRLSGFLGLWDFSISDFRQLFYDFATGRRLLV